MGVLRDMFCSSAEMLFSQVAAISDEAETRHEKGCRERRERPEVAARSAAVLEYGKHRNGEIGGAVALCAPSQKRKWEKALFASAIRCTSSRFFIAPPRPSTASSSSFASRCAIDFSPRFLADSLSQRIARATRRTGRTSTGTW